MKNRNTLSLTIFLALALFFTVIGCKKQEPIKVPPTQPTPPVTRTVVAPPVEPEVKVPAFNEDAYVEIAAYVDFLRDSIKDEDKVTAELIKYVTKYGFTAKDQEELTSQMIAMSNQLEKMRGDPSKGKEYIEKVEQRVRDRLDELRKEELQRLSKEANENQPPPEQPPQQTPDEKKPVDPEQPK